MTAYDSGDMRHFNRYAYAYNNPYKFTDPDGRLAVPFAAGGCVLTGPACPVGAGVGAVIGKAITIVGIAILLNESAGDAPNQDEPAPEPGTAESDEGCIYCVSGENTSSGKDYVGSADDLDRRARDKSDGRDRSGAEKVDSYKKGDRTDRQNKEQKAINERGGKENLDNKRNEVSPKKWEDRRIDPPRSK